MSWNNQSHYTLTQNRKIPKFHMKTSRPFLAYRHHYGIVANALNQNHLSVVASLVFSLDDCRTNCPRNRGRCSANFFLLWYRTWIKTTL